MPTTDVLIDEEHKIVLIREVGATGGFEGFEPMGSYSHGTDHDPEGWVGNHVDYHHVRDMLYKRGEWWPSDFKIVRAVDGGDPIDPLVPGALDFEIATTRQVSGSVPFQMALPNCIVMIVSHSDISNPVMRTIEAKHGDDVLTRVYGYSYRYHQVDYFIGTGLVLEEALLSFTEKNNVPITPIVGRIIDLEKPATLLKTGMNRAYSANLLVDINHEADTKPFMSKAVYVTDGPARLVKLSGEEIITNRMFSVGEVIPYTPVPTDGWVLDGTTWTHTGDTSAMEGPIDGDQDTSHNNGIVMDVVIGEESSLLIQFMSPNGASRNVTYAGPLEMNIHQVYAVSGGYYAAVRITAYNDVVIKNFVVKRDMLSKYVVMSHTPGPVSDPAYLVESTTDKAYYGDLSVITYTLEE